MTSPFRNEGPTESPALNRGGYLEANGTAPNQVVAVCQVSAGSAYADAAVITWPTEAYGHGPKVHLNGSESSCIRLVPPAPGYKSYCYSATLKYHMDGASSPPVGVIPKSAAYNVDAQDGCKFEAALHVEPQTTECLFDIPSDMLRDGCIWGRVDGRAVKLLTVDAEKPAVTIDQSADGAGWLAIMDYGHRQEGIKDGTGSFLAFRSRNDAGQWVDAALLNGGMIDRTAGKEQGDLDVLVYVDGKIGGLGLVGNMTAAGGPPAGVIPVPPGFNSALGLNPPIVRKRLRIGTKIVECDAVQVGDRWLPAYAEVS